MHNGREAIETSTLNKIIIPPISKKELNCQCLLIILTLDVTKKIDVESDTIHAQNIIEWTLGLGADDLTKQ